MTNYDVVKKLIGKIQPVGETNTDDVRYGNLLELLSLADQILFDISLISRLAQCGEYSMSRAGEKAQEFLNEIKEQEK